MAMQALTRWRGGGAAALLLGALFLALLTAENSLPADAEEKTAALPADLAKIPSDGMLVLSSRVADSWGSEQLKLAREKYKKEFEEGINDFRQRFGLSPEQVERLTMLMLDPPPGREVMLLFVRTVTPYDLAKIVAKVKNAKAKKYKDETLYVGDKDWTICPLDDRSLVFGELRDMHALIDHRQPKTEGNLAPALRLAAGKHTVVAGVNIKLLHDSIGNRLPDEAELQPFLPLFRALSATLHIDFAADSRAAAVLTFASDKDAEAAMKPAQTALVLLRAGLDRALAEVNKDKQTKDLVRTLQQFQGLLKAMRIEQKDAALHASLSVKLDSAAVSLALIEAVQKMREAANRAQTQNNLKQIALAMFNYADSMKGRFPPQAIYNKDGKPLLSWRVMILPYIEQQALYQQFHLNEPWDSEHNKKLLAKMPKVYASPEDAKTVQEHTTHYQCFVGEGAFLEGKQGLRLPADFPDGMSNTIMVAVASKAVPWTKPEDIPFDPNKPLPKLGLPGASVFNVAMSDGSVRMVSHNIRPQTLRLAIIRNDGMPLGPDW
jgi:hypothetical protein